MLNGSRDLTALEDPVFRARVTALGDHLDRLLADPLVVELAARLGGLREEVERVMDRLAADLVPLARFVHTDVFAAIMCAAHLSRTDWGADIVRFFGRVRIIEMAPLRRLSERLQLSAESTAGGDVPPGDAGPPTSPEPLERAVELLGRAGLSREDAEELVLCVRAVRTVGDR